MDWQFDLVILGGGINGCGIAADAAQRGLSVLLIEKDDLASKTSSSSSKLIHGGLRYLENFQFSFVRKALIERQRLLSLAPHLIKALPFALPCQASSRSFLRIKTGLFLYDRLSAENTFPKTEKIYRSEDESYFSALQSKFDKGFLFYDAITDDARLTLANALQAKAYGATILNYTKLSAARVKGKLWELMLFSQRYGELKIGAKLLINATGPWVEELNQCLGLESPFDLALVKGSHLVLPKLYEGEHAYLLQHADKRIIFVFPFHGYTVVGTTDIGQARPEDKPLLSSTETIYLLDLLRSYFSCTLTTQDIISSWSGIRPLIYQKGQAFQNLGREAQYFWTEKPAPALALYGGKLTTYRVLAAEIVDQCVRWFPGLRASTTAFRTLPGGSYASQDYWSYCKYADEKYAWLPETLKTRLLQSYGSRIEYFLKGCRNLSDLGQVFGNDLYQAEVDYLIKEEWAFHPDDILWRRTKCGFHYNLAAYNELNLYVNSKVAQPCF